MCNLCLLNKCENMMDPVIGPSRVHQGIPKDNPDDKKYTDQSISIKDRVKDNTEIVQINQNYTERGFSNLPNTSETPKLKLASEDVTDNGDFKREVDRLRTFSNWPVSFLAPKDLAKNGFYYLGRGDEVRCAFCRVEIMKWVPGDDPASDHQRWAPQCPFLRKQPCAHNVPMDGNSSPGHDECGISAPPANSFSSPVMSGPKNTNYATEQARLRSFNDWPKSMRQKPEDLAEAGFFYTGQGDKTKCFYCDGGLKDWEDDDVPWEQHAKWFDRCAYVRLMKGKDFIQRVKSGAGVVETPKETQISTPVTKTTDSSMSTSTSDAKLCKICYDGECNTVFVPCGHVVACAKCALITTSCGLCRTPIQNVIKLYYS